MIIYISNKFVGPNAPIRNSRLVGVRINTGDVSIRTGPINGCLETRKRGNLSLNIPGFPSNGTSWSKDGPPPMVLT